MKNPGEFVVVRGLIVGYASLKLTTTEDASEDLADRTALLVETGLEAMISQLARLFPSVRWEIIDLNGQ